MSDWVAGEMKQKHRVSRTHTKRQEASEIDENCSCVRFARWAHTHTHTPFELWMNLNRLGLRVFAFTVCLNTREIAPILTPNRPILGQVKIGWKIREICHEWFASVCRCAGEIWKVHSIFTCNFHNTNSITSHSHCINGNQVLPFAEARRHALNSSVDDDGREADGNKGRTVCFYVIALIFL